MSFLTCTDPFHTFDRERLPVKIGTAFVWECVCGDLRLDMRFNGSMTHRNNHDKPVTMFGDDEASGRLFAQITEEVRRSKKTLLIQRKAVERANQLERAAFATQRNASRALLDKPRLSLARKKAAHRGEGA
jgi:hypothetical protein